MNLDQALDYRRYGARIWLLLVAAATARASAARELIPALGGVLLWAMLYFVCWQARQPLRRGADAKARVEQAGNLVAGGGLLLFLLQLMTLGIQQAMLTLLAAGLGALFVIAEKRSHLWLIMAAALTAVLFAAAESRSPVFLPALAWFSFAALGVLTFDQSHSREILAGAQPSAVEASHGGGLFTAATLCLAVPLYLFMPKPAGLHLGDLQANTANDYREDADPAKQVRSGDADGGNGSGKNKHQAREDRSPPWNSTAIGSAAANDELDINPNPGSGKRDGGLSNGIVMFVKSSERVNLRGKLFDHFEHDRWTRASSSWTPQHLRAGYYEPLPAPTGAATVTQVVEVVANLRPVIYAAPGIRRLRFPGPSVHALNDGTLELPQPLRANTTYSSESQMDLLAGRYLLAGAPDDLAPYLQVPDDLTPRIAALAAQVTAGAHSAQEKAQALESYLRSHYEYSFDTVAPYQGVTPLDWFLFDSRRGHCEFFASALAIMLRQVGVASRLATGFSLGERNPLTGFYEVRGLDGHAWVEAWMPEHGWLMLEPTPFYPLPNTQQDRNVAAGLDQYLERVAQTDQTLTPGSLRAALSSALRDAWQQLRHLQRAIAAAFAGRGWLMLALVLLALAVLQALRLALLAAQDLRDNAQLLRALRGGGTPDITAQALLRSCAQRGQPRPDAATFREHYASLRATHAQLPEAFADQVDAALYGPGAPAAEADSSAAVGAHVAAAIAADRLPRLRQKLESWRTLLRAMLPFDDGRAG